MLKDFRVTDNVSISVGDVYLDLHNDFDLHQVRLTFPTATAEIEFRRRSGVTRALIPAACVLHFVGVDWIQTSHAVVLQADNFVEEIGYKGPTDMDHSWLVREEHSTSQFHLCFRLGNDEFVRIHAASGNALLVVDEGD
jgi:hypothetical protein